LDFTIVGAISQLDSKVKMTEGLKNTSLICLFSLSMLDMRFKAQSSLHLIKKKVRKLLLLQKILAGECSSVGFPYFS